MASSFEAVERELEAIYKDIEKFVDAVLSQVELQPKWSTVNWQLTGPSVLYEEFRRLNGWYDYIITKVLNFEARRNRAAYELEILQASVEDNINSVLELKAQNWIRSGLAREERLALAKIQVGQSVVESSNCSILLNRMDKAIKLAREKASLLAQFKSDAKTASQLMQFGNQLGELK